MKILLPVLTLLAFACPVRGAMSDDDLMEAAVSTDPARGEDAAEEDEALGIIQESDEDLTEFVRDYVSKDAALKGAFFIEVPASGRILRLNLDSIAKKAPEAPNHSRMVEGIFKDAAGKRYPVLFYIQNAGFGGLDIFRIELKKTEEKPKKK